MADVEALIEKASALVPPPPPVTTMKAVTAKAGIPAPLQAEGRAAAINDSTSDVNWERPLDQIV